MITMETANFLSPNDQAAGSKAPDTSADSALQNKSSQGGSLDRVYFAPLKCRELLKLVIDQEKLGNIDGLWEDRLAYTIDWDAVSKKLSTDSVVFTARDCYMQYNNVESKQINNGSWTLVEDKKLLALANKYQECGWVMIAEELKSNRTPLQCLQRYQQALNTKLANTSEWTIAEDNLLKKAAEMYGTKNWQNAANMISGRSAVQCGARYRKSSKIRDDITEGSWLDIDERRLFLGAVAYELPTSSLFKKSEIEIENYLMDEPSLLSNDTVLNTLNNANLNANLNDDANPNANPNDNMDVDDSTGANIPVDVPRGKKKYISLKTPCANNLNNESQPIIPDKNRLWTAVSKLVPGKNDERCREKWVNSLDPTLVFGPFSPREYNLLHKLIDEKGIGNWSEKSQYFPGRTDANIMARWKTHRMSEKNELKDYKANVKLRKNLAVPLLSRKTVATPTSLSGSDFTTYLRADLSSFSTLSSSVSMDENNENGENKNDSKNDNEHDENKNDNCNENNNENVANDNNDEEEERQGNYHNLRKFREGGPTRKNKNKDKNKDINKIIATINKTNSTRISGSSSSGSGSGSNSSSSSSSGVTDTGSSRDSNIHSNSSSGSSSSSSSSSGMKKHNAPDNYRTNTYHSSVLPQPDERTDERTTTRSTDLCSICDQTIYGEDSQLYRYTVSCSSCFSNFHESCCTLGEDENGNIVRNIVDDSCFVCRVCRTMQIINDTVVGEEVEEEDEEVREMEERTDMVRNKVRSKVRGMDHDEEEVKGKIKERNRDEVRAIENERKKREIQREKEKEKLEEEQNFMDGNEVDHEDEDEDEDGEDEEWMKTIEEREDSPWTEEKTGANTEVNTEVKKRKRTIEDKPATIQNKKKKMPTSTSRIKDSNNRIPNPKTKKNPAEKIVTSETTSNENSNKNSVAKKNSKKTSEKIDNKNNKNNKNEKNQIHPDILAALEACEGFEST